MPPQNLRLLHCSQPIRNQTQPPIDWLWLCSSYFEPASRKDQPADLRHLGRSSLHYNSPRLHQESIAPILPPYLKRRFHFSLGHNMLGHFPVCFWRPPRLDRRRQHSHRLAFLCHRERLRHFPPPRQPYRLNHRSLPLPPETCQDLLSLDRRQTQDWPGPGSPAHRLWQLFCRR